MPRSAAPGRTDPLSRSRKTVDGGASNSLRKVSHPHTIKTVGENPNGTGRPAGNPAYQRRAISAVIRTKIDPGQWVCQPGRVIVCDGRAYSRTGRAPSGRLPPTPAVGAWAGRSRPTPPVRLRPVVRPRLLPRLPAARLPPTLAAGAPGGPISSNTTSPAPSGSPAPSPAPSPGSPITSNTGGRSPGGPISSNTTSPAPSGSPGPVSCPVSWKPDYLQHRRPQPGRADLVQHHQSGSVR